MIRPRCAVLLVAAAGWAQGGCVPTLAYALEGAGGSAGYYEQYLTAKQYRIGYSASADAPTKEVERLLLRRIAESTLLRGYSRFSLADRRIDRNVYILYGADGVRAEYRGDFTRWHRYWRWYCLARRRKGCHDDPLWPSPKPPVRRMALSYVVTFHHQDEARWDALDAEFVLGQLGLPVPQVAP